MWVLLNMYSKVFYISNGQILFSLFNFVVCISSRTVYIIQQVLPLSPFFLPSCSLSLFDFPSHSILFQLGQSTINWPKPLARPCDIRLDSRREGSKDLIAPPPLGHTMGQGPKNSALDVSGLSSRRIHLVLQPKRKCESIRLGARVAQLFVLPKSNKEKNQTTITRFLLRFILLLRVLRQAVWVCVCVCCACCQCRKTVWRLARLQRDLGHWVKGPTIKP